MERYNKELIKMKKEMSIYYCNGCGKKIKINTYPFVQPPSFIPQYCKKCEKKLERNKKNT